MWEAKTNFYVKWSGETIWGDEYSDVAYYEDKEKALEFSVSLMKKNSVKFINLEESTIWRRKEEK
jgi:hypothetical protein